MLGNWLSWPEPPWSPLRTTSSCSAQRPRASRRRSFMATAASVSAPAYCSAPEGIEAAITRHQPRSASDLSRLLNARGHQGDDCELLVDRLQRRRVLLNARGH